MMVEGVRRRRLADTPVRSSLVVQLDAHAPLLEAIATNLDGDAPWSVYADLLQTEGNPRGELISLMLERERQPSARLFEEQRRLFGLHGSTLLPTSLERDRVIAWRRGFVSEVRLDAPEQLGEVQNDLSLRFVRAATLVIDLENWDAWRMALSAARMPWRQLRVDIANGDALVVAPIFACAPMLETVRIENPPELIWEDARAEALSLLVLVNAGDVTSLDDAELPRLEELRVLGESVVTNELRASGHWNRLKRVVTPAVDEEQEEAEEEQDEDTAEGPDVRVATPVACPLVRPPRDDDRYHDDDPEDQPTTAAFFLVGQAIEPAMLAKLATRIRVGHLSSRMCIVPRLPRPITAIQLFGTPDAELLPYGLAFALQNVLADAPPITLVEVDGDRAARFLVLGDDPTRGKSRPDDAVRRALDLALGCDFGSFALHDILDELSATPIQCLLGNGGADQLTMIDPSTAPLVVHEEAEHDDDDDEDEDDEYGYDYDWEDHEQAQSYEEPRPDDDDEDEPVPAPAPPPPPPITLQPVTVAVEVVTSTDEVEDEPDVDDEPTGVVTRAEQEDALVPPPERTELWFEFREHWDDRAIAVDDESHEERWPDPERLNDETEIDLENQVAEPACAKHCRALDYCTSCSAPHCVECGGEDLCSACFATLVETTALELEASQAELPQARRLALATPRRPVRASRTRSTSP